MLLSGVIVSTGITTTTGKSSNILEHFPVVATVSVDRYCGERKHIWVLAWPSQWVEISSHLRVPTVFYPGTPRGNHCTASQADSTELHVTVTTLPMAEAPLSIAYPVIIMTDVKKFSGAFANWRKVNVSFVMSVCPHGTTRLPLNVFWWHLVKPFSKICRNNLNLIKIWQE